METGDTYPEQLAESARLVADAAGLDDWLVAWQSAGRTPEPWLGPDVRDVVRDLAADDWPTPSSSARSGSWRTTSRCSTTSMSRSAAIAAAAGLGYARTASLNDDPAFIAALADLIVAADGAP